MKRIATLLSVSALACALLTGCSPRDAARPAETAASGEPKRWAPTRAIELVVGSSPGGGADLHARKLSEIAFQHNLIPNPMTITYKTGATGNVAFNYVVSKKDDPHTLMIGNTGYTIAAVINNSPIKIEQMGILGVMAEDEYIVYVRKDSPFKSAADIVEAMRTRQKTVTWSGGLVGSIDHVAYEMFAKAAGVKGSYVGFNGQSDAVTALLGGHIEVGIFTPYAAAGQAASGDFVPLFSMADRELDGNLKGVPTARSLGYDVVFKLGRLVLGTPQMPVEAVAFYEEMIQKVMQTPEWKEYITANRLTERYMNAKDARAFLIKDTAEVADMLKKAGII